VSIYRFIDLRRSRPLIPSLYAVQGLECLKERLENAWKDRPPSKRARENAALTERIQGDPPQEQRNIRLPQRVHAELRAVGIHCNRKRVARLMRKGMGLEAACEGVGESTPPARTL
jgi:hypothetical protein